MNRRRVPSTKATKGLAIAIALLVSNPVSVVAQLFGQCGEATSELVYDCLLYLGEEWCHTWSYPGNEKWKKAEHGHEEHDEKWWAGGLAGEEHAYLQYPCNPSEEDLEAPEAETSADRKITAPKLPRVEHEVITPAVSPVARRKVTGHSKRSGALE